MAKFRTKVVEVDALLYTYPASEEMKAFCGNAYYSEDAGDATHTPEMGLMIDDACHIVNEGDWVVKNDDGLGVFTETEFRAEYEPAICRLCDDTGMFYGNVGPCNCEASLKLQAEKQADRFNCTATEYLNRNCAFGRMLRHGTYGKYETRTEPCICNLLQTNTDPVTHTAKSKTEDLRDILPPAFNNSEEHW